jgi:hypothetical protein
MFVFLFFPRNSGLVKSYSSYEDLSAYTISWAHVGGSFSSTSEV